MSFFDCQYLFQKKHDMSFFQFLKKNMFRTHWFAVSLENCWQVAQDAAMCSTVLVSDSEVLRRLKLRSLKSGFYTISNWKKNALSLSDSQIVG